MCEVERKKLVRYDMKRVLSRVEKEYGKIERGTEDDYYPQLGYIEHSIYDLYDKFDISDYELQDVILACIYDLKGYVDNKVYDYTDIIDDRLIECIKEFELLFNPFVNDEIKINEKGKNDLKGLFTLPIICLDRLYYSVDFWRSRYGKNGYFRMLEEMVLGITEIGNFPYALDEKYLVE